VQRAAKLPLTIAIAYGHGILLLAIDHADLVLRHQANSRIIESVAKYAGIATDKVHFTAHKYET
jgi:hypothetical protein